MTGLLVAIGACAVVQLAIVEPTERPRRADDRAGAVFLPGRTRGRLSGRTRVRAAGATRAREPLGAAHAEEEVGEPEDREEREDARSEKHRPGSGSMCAEGEGPDQQRDRDGDERVIERFLRELDTSIVRP
jgi:hypothetical protein